MSRKVFAHLVVKANDMASFLKSQRRCCVVSSYFSGSFVQTLNAGQDFWFVMLGTMLMLQPYF